MKLIKLLFNKTFMSNFIVFMILSMLVTSIFNLLPTNLFTIDKWLFRERKWERSGEIYQQWVKVKHWKKYLPELSDFIKTVFPKKQIRDFSKDYLETYLAECCRSEMAHWCIIFSSLLFFMWNEPADSLVIIVIAIVLNLPYIIIQRYNRPRIIEAVEAMDSHRRKIMA